MPIRAASPQDIPGVVQMAARVYLEKIGKKDFNEAVSAGNWIHLVSSGEGAVFVAEDESGITGLICGYRSRNIDTGKATAQIWHWYTGPRGKGQGVSLLKRFEAWASSKGCEVVSIGCTACLWSDRHRKLYDRLGYTLESMSFVKEK